MVFVAICLVLGLIGCEGFIYFENGGLGVANVEERERRSGR